MKTSKTARASKLAFTGLKVGRNYLKYYAKKSIGNKNAKEDLEISNAENIYKTLSELKGGALKAAQFLSMDKNFVPKIYRDKFKLAQCNATSLSYPLVVNLFKNNFDKNPTQIFDTFSKEAIHSASIGQVHKATLDGKTYAVKVQYPGVAKSISSDMKWVRKIANKALKLKPKDLEKYLDEVERKLKQETDYKRELKMAMEISEAYKEDKNISFPKYYKDLSTDNILTMSWEEGIPLTEYLETNPTQDQKNKIGQTIWDFYKRQLFDLFLIHADPHPGNFLVKKNGDITVIDFGCVKKLPKKYGIILNELIYGKTINNKANFSKLLVDLKLIKNNDSPEEIEYFTPLFSEIITLLTKPFQKSKFDFGDKNFMGKFKEIITRESSDKKILKLNPARGTKHLIFINRIIIGLFTIMDELNAKIEN